jgi:hypothetical protein
VRAGYFSRPAGERKRRALALTEDSSAANPPRPSVLLTPSEKASRVAVRKNTRIGKATTFHARACQQGGSQP